MPQQQPGLSSMYNKGSIYRGLHPGPGKLHEISCISYIAAKYAPSSQLLLDNGNAPNIFTDCTLSAALRPTAWLNGATPQAERPVDPVFGSLHFPVLFNTCSISFKR